MNDDGLGAFITVEMMSIDQNPSHFPGEPPKLISNERTQPGERST
jgi:hypothetical protein